MTNEATRLARELRHYADAIEDEFSAKTLPRRRIGDAGDCAAPVMRQAAKLLATLAQPAVSEDAQSIPLGAIRAIAVEAIREVTGCPDILSGEKSLVDALEEVAKAACATFAAMASQEKPHD